MKKKLLLTILDGWGENKNPKYNAIEVGKTPTWHKIAANNPNAHLITFGKEVGLPDGQMGNSEVGHTNIGAGRVVFQELPRINNAIADKSFDSEKPIQETIALLKKSQKLYILWVYFPMVACIPILTTFYTVWNYLPKKILKLFYTYSQMVEILRHKVL